MSIVDPLDAIIFSPLLHDLVEPLSELLAGGPTRLVVWIPAVPYVRIAGHKGVGVGLFVVGKGSHQSPAACRPAGSDFCLQLCQKAFLHLAGKTDTGHGTLGGKIALQCGHLCLGFTFCLCGLIFPVWVVALQFLVGLIQLILCGVPL